MAEREMRQLVGWTVDDTPPQARLRSLLGTVVAAVDTVAALGSATGASARPTWTLGRDADAYVDIGQVHVRGDAPWLPGRPGARHRLRATAHSVVLDDGGGRRAPRPVPLEELDIARARPRGRRPARHADAQWTLTLTGRGAVDVDGAWLALAWIGMLAGWPEPPAS